MSANTAIFIKETKNGYRVYFQTCADNSDLGTLEGKYKTLKGAVKKAKELQDQSEYGTIFV